MALNWTMLKDDRSPVPLPHEMNITQIPGCVEIAMTVPNKPPAGGSSATAGGSGGSSKYEASKGSIWLTDQRLIYTTPASTSWDSLSVPLPSILSTRFEQPTFGSNHLDFEVKPSPEGGLVDGTRVELRFKDRAMFEFVAILEKTRERAIYMKREAANEGEGLPSYTSPGDSSSSVTFVGGVPVDNPPGYDS